MAEEKEKLAVLTCPFCKGRAVDPFGLLSKLSRCEVCKGKGEVTIREPFTQCAFCGGRGIQPYTTSRLHCLACGGKGVVPKIEPSQPCPKCGGRGVHPRRPHPVACPKCRGQGVIRAVKEAPHSKPKRKTPRRRTAKTKLQT